MRKPRDYDAELKALNDKTRTLKERKIRQLGELVIATGADALDIDTLAGGLLAIVAEIKAEKREALRKSGAAFFQRNGQAETGDRLQANTASPRQAISPSQPFELKSGEN